VVHASAVHLIEPHHTMDPFHDVTAAASTPHALLVLYLTRRLLCGLPTGLH